MRIEVTAAMIAEGMPNRRTLSRCVVALALSAATGRRWQVFEEGAREPGAEQQQWVPFPPEVRRFIRSLARETEKPRPFAFDLPLEGRP